MALDAELFDAHMDDPSTLSMLLKGHLWLEHALARSIGIALNDASKLDVDRMSFSGKIDLVLASGALPSEFESPLRRVNKVRNRSAHNLDFTITASEVASLKDSLTGLARSAFERIREDEDDVRTTLRRWLHTVLFCIEWMNLKAEYAKVNQQSLETYGIIRALEERSGRVPDDEALREQYGVPPEPTPGDVWTVSRTTSSAS